MKTTFKSLLIISIIISQSFPQKQTDLLDSNLFSEILIFQISNPAFNSHESVVSDDQNYTLMLAENWDGTSWAPSYRVFYSYNPDGDLMEYKNQNWTGGEWQNKYHEIFFYQNRLVRERISQTWSNEWVNDSKIQFTYDENGCELSMTFSSSLGNTWADMTKYEHSRNNSTHMIDSTVCRIWDLLRWNNSAKYVWLKNDQHKDSIVYNYRWIGNNWVNGYRHSYSYNSSTPSYTLTHESWNGSSYNSNDKECVFFDVDGKHLYSYSQYWDGKWRNQTKCLLTYNDQGKIIEVLNQVSDLVGFFWINDNRDKNEYDSAGRLLTTTNQVWDGMAWSDNQRYSYFYGSINEIKDKSLVKNFVLNDNYPNPFNPTTIIKFSIPEEKQITLKVFDVIGNEIATLLDEKKISGEYLVEFNASSLPSGTYIYIFQAGELVQAKKMILLK